jgi:hypothetical protein
MAPRRLVQALHLPYYFERSAILGWLKMVYGTKNIASRSASTVLFHY